MTCTQDRFLKDCTEHTIRVVRDDGVDRHLVFQKPGTSCNWFEIVTWPGVLAIRGDHGAYMLSRQKDMFEFFRQAGDRINPGYWMEKIIAVDSNCGQPGSAENFSADVFKRNVVEWFRRYTDARWYPENRADRWALWEAIREMLADVDSHDESHNWSLLRDFSIWNEETCKHEYRDFFSDWEMTCKEFDFHFIWNCYAIAWAIKQYDTAKANTREAA